MHILCVGATSTSMVDDLLFSDEQSYPTPSISTCTTSSRTPGLDYILFDSGAATHVCPRDYANQFLLELCGASTPRLFTVTNDEIPLYGVRKVHYKSGTEGLMIPFYVCDVKYPILSVTRLLVRGFQLRLTPEATTLRSDTFQAALHRDSNLLYLAVEQQNYHQGTVLCAVRNDDGQVRGLIAPTSQTSDGARSIMGGNTDYWRISGDYIIRVHKRKRRAKFTPEGTQCPVPTDQLDSWRKTTVRTGEDEKHYFDNYPDVTNWYQETTGLVKLPSDESLQLQHLLIAHNHLLQNRVLP